MIPLRGFVAHVCYVALNQGCCGTCQYNLRDRILRHDFNTTLSEGCVILITLINMAYQIGGSVSPIYPWVICPVVFNFFLLVLVFNISVECL